jgi:hypothetical protein
VGSIDNLLRWLDGGLTVPWRWEDIKREWLGDSLIAEDPAVVVEAFERIDAMFGPEWILAYRTDHGGSNHTGATLTLPVVILGKQLKHIERASGCEALARGLRESRSSAKAELDAISLLMAGSAGVSLECEPKVVVSGRERKADFRVSKGAGGWIYGEVTQPNRSATTESLTLAMKEVADVVRSIDGSYATEVFFDKSPTPAELSAVRPLLEDGCRRGENVEQELPDGLGVLYVGQTPPGTVVLEDHGRPYRPGLGVMSVSAGATGHRHVAVRVPYFDAGRTSSWS